MVNRAPARIVPLLASEIASGRTQSDKKQHYLRAVIGRKDLGRCSKGLVLLKSGALFLKFESGRSEGVKVVMSITGKRDTDERKDSSFTGATSGLGLADCPVLPEKARRWFWVGRDRNPGQFMRAEKIREDAPDSVTILFLADCRRRQRSHRVVKNFWIFLKDRRAE